MLENGNVAHRVLVESELCVRIAPRRLNQLKMMFKNRTRTRYLIKNQQSGKEIALIQRKHQRSDLALCQWKPVFSDFRAFEGLNQA